MSTILDALKKSEQERKLSNIPTLADMPTPQEASRWPHVLLLAILVLLLVLIGFAIKLTVFPSLALSVVDVADGDAKEVLAVSGSAESLPESESVISEDEIVVSVVSYSDTPTKRFIMINGKLVKENEFVRAGLKVEQIRQNDVVLNLRGKQIIRRP